MADISGTFRTSGEAQTSIDRLKAAGFRIDQIGLAEAKADTAVASGREAVPAGTPNQRVMLTVHAADRAAEARAILAECGAFDLNSGDDADRTIREPVREEGLPTPFGDRGDVANGLT
jgi:hypothetical protein